MSEAAGLFSAGELRRLERLRLRRRRTRATGIRGSWRSPHLGAGGLFADHRAYVPGDDLRYVDWNVYGRLGHLVVKRFEAEESVRILIAVDRSLSMEGAKSHAARRLAGALGHLALAHLDQVRLAWLPRLPDRPPALFRGRGRSALLLEELATVPDGGGTDHAADLGAALGALHHRGLALLLSDFYDPAGAIRGLALLRHHGLDVGALHVVDARDADLPVGASLTVVDRETGATRAVDATEDLQERVRRAWRGRALGLERWCLAREIGYQRVDARRSLWDVLGEMLAGAVAVGA